MASVFLAAAISLGAQEAGDINSEETGSNTRPAETELLLNQDDGAADIAVTPEQELPGVGFGDFVRMILVLALVIGLIYGFVWILRKFSSQKAESEDIINLLSTRPLKGDSALHLVEVGTRVFLVGSNSSSVSLVSEIDDDESLDNIRLAASRAPHPAGTSFARMFRDRFGGGPVQNGPETDENTGVGENGERDPSSFIRSQRERLKDL